MVCRSRLLLEAIVRKNCPLSLDERIFNLRVLKFDCGWHLSLCDPDEGGHVVVQHLRENLFLRLVLLVDFLEEDIASLWLMGDPMILGVK